MFDTHCHLQDERIASDIDGVITNARGAGVGRMLVCGTCEGDWGAVERIGERYRNDVICAFGVHPWYAGDAGDGWEPTLISYLERIPAAAVGEIGIDKSSGCYNYDKQADIFTRQLKIAQELKRPVSIHCRKAWEPLVNILKDIGGLTHGGAIHSYSGSPDLIDDLEKLGCYISFSGSILNDNNKRAANSIKRVSPERLLIETDSPDLLPQGAPAPHNVPANLCMIRDKVAEILKMSPDDAGSMTYNNSVRLFNVKPHNRVLE